MILTPDASKYIEGVLRDIGAPINTVTLGGFYTWLENEQGQNLSAFEQNKGNPLGIQTPEAQAAGKAGDVNAAIANTAALLKANYPNIVNAFKTASSVQEIGQAIVASPWNNGKSDGSGYGGLQNFMAPGTGNVSVAPTATPVQAHKATAPALPQAPAVVGLNQQYNGPGAYKGFDLSSLAPDLIAPAKNAIDQYLSNPGLENTVLNDIYTNYGQEAWAANNPEVRTLLVVGSLMGWDKDPAIFQAQLQRTKWWKSTSDNMRMWQETQANNPGQAQQAIAEAQARVQSIADQLGVQLDPSTLNQIAHTVASQSVTSTGVYSNTQFTDSQIYQMVDAHFSATRFMQGVGQTAVGGTPAAATAQNTSGDAAALYNQFQTIARNYYLNLTPQQISTYVQQYLTGDTGQGNFQSGAISGFTTTAQNMAKQMYPGLASAIGTVGSTGLDNTPYQSTAWARNMIAQYTGLGSGDNVNLMDPQWSWILSGKPAPPAGSVPGLLTQNPNGNAPGTGTGQIPSADDLQRYLMSTPQFQKTDAAKNMGWQVGSSILKAFGYGA